ncbi:hypothetical protein [Streptomyces sp. A3M-1-3]|uniref:hypothetical protein n=1 Tax=Streptomyces sp. A3M-1-3 TaxID=2962044 RepID=UPI0027E4AEDF|nr:hypothetical protein [Streptomyces sp. A3M-1-3]
MTPIAAWTSPACSGRPSRSASAVIPAWLAPNIAPWRASEAHSAYTTPGGPLRRRPLPGAAAPDTPAGWTTRAVGCSAKQVPNSAISTAAPASATAGWAATAAMPTRAGPRTKETSSRVPSKESALFTTRSSCPPRRASATSRVLAGGPISGTVPPASAPSSARATVPRPAGAPATSTAMATALSQEATRTTGGCPRRSASRPSSGPHTTHLADGE